MNQKLRLLEYKNDEAESSKMAQQIEEKHEIISINNNNIESINKGVSNLITLHCKIWLDQNTYVPLAATLERWEIL